MELSFDFRLSDNDLKRTEGPPKSTGSFPGLGKEVALGVKVPLADFMGSLRWIALTGEAAYRTLSGDEGNLAGGQDVGFLRLGAEFRSPWYLYGSLRGGVGFGSTRTDFGGGRFPLPNDFSVVPTGSVEVGARHCFGDRACIRGAFIASYERAVGGEERSRYENWGLGGGIGIDFVAM